MMYGQTFGMETRVYNMEVSVLLSIMSMVF